MKTTLMTMLFLLGSANAFALPPKNAPNHLKVSEEKCNEIAKKELKIFEEQQGLQLQAADIYNEETGSYLFNAKTKVFERMSKICSTKKDNTILADIIVEHSLSCSESCQDTKTYFKDKGTKDRAKRSENICSTICDVSTLRLNAIGEGVGMALKEMPASDCTGAVTDSGRSKTKEPSWEEVQKNMSEYGTALQVEKIKKASGK